MVGDDMTSQHGPAAGGADLAQIRAQIAACDSVLERIQQWAPDRWRALNRRGTLHRRLHAVTLDAADLAAAVTDLEAARDAADLHPEGWFAAHDLGNALLQQYEYSLDDTVLARATAVLEQAEAAAALSRHPGRQEVLNSLASAYERGWTAHYDPELLRDAVRLQRLAVDLTAAAAADLLPRRLANLSDYLWSWYSYSGRPENAAESLAAARRALSLAQPGHPHRRDCLVVLANRCLNTRSLLGDARVLVDEAVRHATAAAATPAGSVIDEETAHQALANAYSARFALTRAPADLDLALTYQQRVVDLIPPKSMNRATALANLGHLHWAHGDATGDSGSRNAAARLFGEAEGQAAGGRDAQDFRTLRDAASTHSLPPADAASAEQLARAALDSVGALDARDAQRQPQLLHAALALIALYRGSPATQEARAEQAQDVLRLLPTDGPLGPRVRAAQAELLRVRALHTFDPRHLDEAIAAQHGAVEAMQAAGDALADGQDDILTGLLEVRAHTGEGRAAAPDRELLAQVLRRREAAALRPMPPADRLDAAQSRGRCAALLGRWRQASEAYRAALGVMDALAPAHLEHSDRETLLARLHSLPADAAAVSLRLGDARAALEAAESGRGLLISESVGLRDQFPEVEAFDPELARRLLTARARLTRWREPGMRWASPDSAADGGALLRYRTMSAELAQVLREIRAHPPLRDFLLPQRAAELLAQPGPVVVVFCSVFGSAALVTHPDGPAVVDLPFLTPGRIAAEIKEFDRALGITGSADASRAERNTAEVSLTRLLAFLWNALAQPVLDDPQVARLLADPAAPRSLDGRPRLWWCPIGSLGLLPLHAAGAHPHARAAHPADRLSVLDRVVSSYASSLTALRSARATPRLPPDGGILTVALPDTPGRPPLTLADDEIASVAAWAPGHEQLLGPDATRSRVMQRLRSADWLHFVGHAEQGAGPTGTSSGLLVTHDHLTAGAIGVADLLRDGAVRRHWLAYLSACSTARGRPELVDQSLHVAGALQAAGFAHVVATHWPVRSDIAAKVAQDFYAELPPRSAVRHQDVALALDEAVRLARYDRPDRPSWWAPTHHRGP